MLIVLDTAVAVVFHLQIGTLFHGEEIAVDDTGHRIVVGSDICTGLNRQIGIVTVVDTELSIVVH